MGGKGDIGSSLVPLSSVRSLPKNARHSPSWQSPNHNESSYSTSMHNKYREFYQTFALYLRAEATHLEEYILGKSKNKIQNRKIPSHTYITIKVS